MAPENAKAVFFYFCCLIKSAAQFLPFFLEKMQKQHKYGKLMMI
jgi:hypothetical protein